MLHRRPRIEGMRSSKIQQTSIFCVIYHTLGQFIAWSLAVVVVADQSILDNASINRLLSCRITKLFFGCSLTHPVLLGHQHKRFESCGGGIWHLYSSSPLCNDRRHMRRTCGRISAYLLPRNSWRFFWRVCEVSANRCNSLAYLLRCAISSDDTRMFRFSKLRQQATNVRMSLSSQLDTIAMRTGSLQSVRNSRADSQTNRSSISRKLIDNHSLTTSDTGE